MKGLLFALALNLFFAFVGLTERNVGNVAYAATDVHVVVSSALPSRITVTTGTAIRVDNWNKGVQGTIVPNRVSICLQNHDAADNISLGFDSQVSTNTTTVIGTSTVGGFILSPGNADFTCIGALRGLAIWGVCADDGGAGGCNISTIQYGKE